MSKAKAFFAFVAVAVLAGCATAGEKEYVKVYDRKYNEIRLVESKDPGTFVGTSAVKTPARQPGQHP